MSVRFLVDTEVAGRQYAAGASVWLDSTLARRLLAVGLVELTGPRVGASVAPRVGARHGDPRLR